MRRSPSPAGRVGSPQSELEPPRIRGALFAKPRFLVLVLQVAFVGAVVGTERTVLPVLAESEFGLASKTAVLSFILAFGLAKAPANLLAGRLADRFGRKRVLVLGWIIGLPAPLLIAFAPSWSWVIGANLLLGVQQGFCWSTTIFMKVDLAGVRRGGFAIGVNEFFGYAATAVAAYTTGVLAAHHGPRVAPFLLGAGLAVAGLVSAIFLVKASPVPRDPASTGSGRAGAKPSFVALSQAGFVIKLGDVATWGMLPLYFTQRGASITTVGLLAAAYPAAWALLQPLTGRISDHKGRRTPIVVGMALQGVALVALALGDSVAQWLPALVLLGSGTALAYPVLLAAAGECVDASQRATAIGLYRLWRDLGFVGGALLVGIAADAVGVRTTLALLGVVAAVSGVIVRMSVRAALGPEAEPVSVLADRLAEPLDLGRGDTGGWDP